MEWKIGEIFEYNGEWYQCVEGNDCANCVFIDYCKSHLKEERDNTIGLCVSFDRNDGVHVIFKKLEKVGEPYRRWLSPFNNIMVQRYRLYGRNIIMPDEPYMYFNAIDNTIEIELKTKGDMEEKKLNLKPVDIQKAREGKPVCTRDGRKARIICFDYNGETGDYPIVALVHYNKGNKCYETVLKYTSDGLFNKYGDCQHNDDLMMLPEKKEGWVNVMEGTAGKVYVGNDIYRTEDEAKEGASRFTSKLIANVPIEWEE